MASLPAKASQFSSALLRDGFDSRMQFALFDESEPPLRFDDALARWRGLAFIRYGNAFVSGHANGSLTGSLPDVPNSISKYIRA